MSKSKRKNIHTSYYVILLDKRRWLLLSEKCKQTKRQELSNQIKKNINYFILT